MHRNRFTFALVAAAALAAPASAQVKAYLVDSDLDRLYSVDLTTGAATFIASTLNNGLATPADLSWDAAAQRLWTVDLSGGALGTIDTTTGVFTSIYKTGYSGAQGMAWDPMTQKFYLANQDGFTYAFDPATQMTTQLGPTGFGLITCLDVDANGTLFGIDFFAGTVVRIDKNTGVGTAISGALTGFQGLGIDPTDGTWYAANTNDDALYKVNPATGASVLIGPNGSSVQFAKGFDLAESGCSLVYGKGCPGSGGFVPDLTLLGCATAGSTTAVFVQQALGGATALLAFGSTQGSVPMGAGCSLLVTPLLPFLPAFPLSGAGPGNGVLVLPGPVPPGVGGLSITLQVFVADPGGALGFANSNGLKITFQ